MGHYFDRPGHATFLRLWQELGRSPAQYFTGVFPPLSASAAPERRASELMLLSSIGPETVAIPVAFVEEVTLAAALAALGGARPPALGYLDLRGDTVLVVDAHALLGLPVPRLAPSDRFIVIGSADRRFALRVDRVIGLQSTEVVGSAELIAGGLGCRLRPGRQAATAEPAMVGILDVETTIRSLAGLLSAAE